MKTWLKYTLIAAAVAGAGTAVYFLTSAGKSRLLPFVPNNAAFVVKIDLKGMHDIFTQNNLDKLEVVKEGMSLSKKEGGTLGKLLNGLIDKPMESGIRLQAPVFIFGEKITRGPATAILIELSNQDKFTEFVSKRKIAGTQIEKEGDFSYIECETGLYLAWGNDVMILSNQMTEGQNYPLGILKRSTPGSEGNLFVKKMMEEKGVISFLMKPELMAAFNDNVSLRGMEAFASGVSKGMAFTGSLDFNNGAVNMTYKAVATDDKALSELNVLNAAGKTAKYLPEIKLAQEPALMASASLNLKAYLDLIKKNLESDQRESLDKDETVKMLLNTLTGDIVFCMAPMKMGEFRTEPGDWQVVLGTHKRATELESRLREMGWVNESGDIIIPMLRQKLEFRDQCITLGDRTGNKAVTMPAAVAGYATSPMTAYFDTRNFFSSLNGDIPEEVKPWIDADPKLLMGGSYTKMNIDLVFANKNRNALAILLETANKSYLLDKKMSEGPGEKSADTVKIKTLENSKY